MEDYEGITRVRAYSGRPLNKKSFSKALKLLAIGLKMYSLIRSVQEGGSHQDRLDNATSLREDIEWRKRVIQRLPATLHSNLHSGIKVASRRA